MPYTTSRVNTNEIARQNENYKDLDLDFLPHPVTKDLRKKRGIEAVKRSMRNLLFLHRGELGFNPDKGSGIWHTLFQPFNHHIAAMMAKEIQHTLDKYEPRARVYMVNVEDDEGRNGVNIDIHFDMINYNEPGQLTVFIERVR